MDNPILVRHPLIEHKLAFLRDRRTPPKEFRELIEEISLLLAYEVFRDLELFPEEIETPLIKTTAFVTKVDNIALFPILRAGLTMVGSILKLIPNAHVGHLGIYRDHQSLLPITYYSRFPQNLPQLECIICDPMLATGGSLIEAVEILKDKGAKKIKVVSIISSRQGINNLLKAHQDVLIFTAAIDPTLNEHGYIVPGLGDAGDRLFGT